MAVAHEPTTLEAPPGSRAVLDASLEYLFERLATVEARVREAVERRRAGQDPDPDDRFPRAVHPRVTGR